MPWSLIENDSSTGSGRRNHRSDVTVLEHRLFPLVHVADDHVDHGVSEIIATYHLIREQEAKGRVDRAKQAVTQFGFFRL
jgi:hypothetical protein